MQDTAPTTVDRDHLCIACGYNLRGLPVESQCPECALPVAESLKGDFLAFASAEYRARIILGMRLFGWGIALFFVMSLTITALASLVAPGALLNEGVRMAFGLVGLVPWGMVVVGVWMFSSADVGFNGSTDPVLARTWTRVSAVAITCSDILPSLAFMILPTTIVTLIGPTFVLVRVAKLLMLAVLLYASVRCIRWIAMRIPSPVWVRRATRRMWLLPVLTIVPLTTVVTLSFGGGMARAGGTGLIAVLGLGTVACWIVVVIMYLSLVISVQKEVSRVHATAANTGRV